MATAPSDLKARRMRQLGRVNAIVPRHDKLNAGEGARPDGLGPLGWIGVLLQAGEITPAMAAEFAAEASRLGPDGRVLRPVSPAVQPALAPQSFDELKAQLLRASELAAAAPGAVRTGLATDGVVSRSAIGGAPDAAVRPQQPAPTRSVWTWTGKEWVITPGTYELQKAQLLPIPLKASEVAAQRLTGEQREARYQAVKEATLRNPGGSARLEASEYAGSTANLAEAAQAYMAMKLGEGVKITLAEATVAVAPRRRR